MVTAEDVKRIARPLPRTEEAVVRDQVKFRVRGIVYLALSRDEQSIGIGFPKEERDAVVQAEPAKFFLPRESDLRFHWIRVQLSALDVDELHELILDAWRMVVPKFVAREYLSRPGASGSGPGSSG